MSLILDRLRQLPLGRRLRAIGALLLGTLFVTTVLLRGVNDKFRKPVWPAFAWFGDSMGMARAWGMFATPETENPVFVFSKSQSEEVQLSPLPHASMVDRILDQRMRKFRSHLRHQGNRANWGTHFSEQFCSEVPRSAPGPVSIVVREMNGENAGQGTILLETPCPE